VDNYIIEKGRFSTGKNAAMIRTVAPYSLVLEKNGQKTSHEL